METVAIFGVGLIGGSFALALKKAGFRGRIVGVSSPATIEAAVRVGAIDESLPADAAARSADLIYLAQPIGRILDTIGEINAWVRPDALITDAGSTKSAIVARAQNALTRCRFLGGHPLAGKESRGVESACADLFRGRMYVLTPLHKADLDTAAAAAFIDWLKRFGATPYITTAEDHDEVVARSSHLPQLASTALALTVGGAPPILGPALIDSTRLALSPFDIWRDIFDTNRDRIDRELAHYIEQLQRLRHNLTSPEMRHLFEEAGDVARRVRETK